ncbi:nuclear transport factor 2 family protein [Chryseobacterium sp. MHB01]|uniref:nuclear transport factor 2 family protein n=1 Tax=unclassified Chryseobacterium TaxID=2593645 RepID=UPI002AFF2A9D|nr:nuclear transport factor 2 family protein [Chryseobacterium sp. MHB01]MEA1847600.1 nuclear transport factor 2 family protein [Chryseobacterium sp. MHB01]
MKITNFVEEFIASSNAYDTVDYVSKWQTDVILDDPSVGNVYVGHSEIKNYFESYFIGYRTQTKLIKLDITSDNKANLEVEFTGSFPEGKIKGFFSFTFEEGRISKAFADLL